MARDESNGFGNVRRPNNTERILYVEPNDIYGEINGVTVTPDYTDYSIWCNLTVEKYSRIKSGMSGESGRSNSTIYNFFWDATKTDGTNYISYMSGKQDGSDYNFLTTDYTEIDFNEVKNRNFIEGLGIESVNIAMNNYYVPEITINFVDVRGSGFFSREEATHDTFDLINLEKDKYGNLTDNFYSCFVSFPYPRFRLQVKGFYGKPVTYQLTCSSFTGSLDSATGNFKLTAKFIGYFYGIMTDIPYEYLVAAPLCTYTGEAYWNSHVNSEDWQLDDGRPPVKLYDFYKDVSDAMQKTNMRAKLIGTENNDALEHCKAMIKGVDSVKKALNLFKESLNKDLPVNIIECNEVNSSQYILLAKTDKINIPNSVCKRYNNLVERLDAYTKEYGSSSKTESGETLDNSKRPGTQEDRWVAGQTALSEFFTVVNGKLYCNGKDLYNKRTDLSGVYVATCSPSNGNGAKKTAVSEDMSKTIKESEYKYNSIIENKTFYACAIDFNRIETTINDISTKLQTEQKKIENELSKKQTETVIEMFGFAPYVGNFFKIVMCHLETFVAIIYDVAEKIDGQVSDGNREPKKLRIREVEKETDVVKLNFIPPWPAIYKKRNEYDPSDSEEEDQVTRYDTFGDDSDTRGWVGDCLDGEVEWEEKKMLKAFYYALISVLNPNDADGTDLSTYKPSINSDIAPSLPSDLYTGVFDYGSESKDKLAAYIGMRLMQICAIYNRGNVNERYAKAFAVMDAYNFFNQTDYDTVKDLIKSSNGGITDELYNLMLAKENGRRDSLSYEFKYVVNKRHPIYVEKGNTLEYAYMYTKNGIPLIPATANNLSQKEIGKHFTDEGSGKFTPNYEAQNQYSQVGNGCQYAGTTDSLLDNYNGGVYTKDDIKKGYTNPSLFYLVTDEDSKSLVKWQEMMSSGEFATGNSYLDNILGNNQKLFSDFSRKYWKTMDTDGYLSNSNFESDIIIKKSELNSITPTNIKYMLSKRVN